MADEPLPPDADTVAILSDADADLRMGLRTPDARRLREYTAVVEGGARVEWWHRA
jgi:hypothetical protein